MVEERRTDSPILAGPVDGAAPSTELLRQNLGPLVAQPIDHGQRAGGPVEVGYLNWRAIEMAVVEEELQPPADLLGAARAKQGDDLLGVEQAMALDAMNDLEVAVGEMEVSGRDSLEARPPAGLCHVYSD